ncbi:MAG: helix-turn-helix domain-containing protein [Myxococcales bacterium]
MSFEETIAALVRAEIAPLRAELQRLLEQHDAKGARAAIAVDEVLTVAEGASEAKVSKKTIRAACDAGAIDANKPAGCSEWRFTRRALRAWLEGPRPRPRPAPTSLDSDAGPRQAVAKLVRGTR